MFFIAGLDKMADDCEQFARPVNSVERLGNKAKMPEVAISKREDSKASMEQVDFLKAPKERSFSIASFNQPCTSHRRIQDCSSEDW